MTRPTTWNLNQLRGNSPSPRECWLTVLESSLLRRCREEWGLVTKRRTENFFIGSVNLFHLMSSTSNRNLWTSKKKRKSFKRSRRKCSSLMWQTVMRSHSRRKVKKTSIRKKLRILRMVVQRKMEMDSRCLQMKTMETLLLMLSNARRTKRTRRRGHIRAEMGQRTVKRVKRRRELSLTLTRVKLEVSYIHLNLSEFFMYGKVAT